MTATALTDWIAPNRLRVSMSLDWLSLEDLHEIAADATDLAWVYHARERMLLSSSLLALAGAAETEFEGREREGVEQWSASIDVSLEFDPTSNPEQNMDELGTLMAHVMVFAERDSIEDRVAWVWFGVVRQLARERDRLRREGVVR